MKEKDKLIDEMVNKFLRWEIPKDFSPDGGITFKNPKDLYPHIPNPENLWPTGTNLLDASQAKELMKYLLEEDN